MPDHVKVIDGKRPHLGRYLIKKQCMDAVRLFEVTRHFCEQFVWRDPDVYRKMEAVSDIILDLCGSGDRRFIQPQDRSEIKKTFIDRDLLDIRGIRMQQIHHFFAVRMVKRVIRCLGGKKRTFPKGGDDRLSGVDTKCLGGFGFREDDPVTVLFVTADDCRDRAKIRAASGFQIMDGCPA